MSLLRRSENAYIDQVFEKLFDGVVTIKYPEVMLEHELEHEMERFDQRLRRDSGLTLEDYYRVTGQTEEDVQESLQEAVEKRLVRSLVLGKLVEVEQLKASEDEITDEIETSLLSYGGRAPIIRELMSTPVGRQSVEERLLTEKSIQRLILIARGEAPEIGAEEEPEPADEEQAESVEEAVGEAQAEQSVVDEPESAEEPAPVDESQVEQTDEDADKAESASDDD
jgi:FKBP-type peptidyl-prolyl cis-trans isomerase (trigger factor)